jgi:hypothetical protein
MPRVLGQDLPEVSFAVDKQVVEAFAPQRSYISFRKKSPPKFRRLLPQATRAVSAGLE